MPANSHEKDRLLSNLVRKGTIVEHKSKDGKALARVDIHGRKTDWLPVQTWAANAFVKIYIPVTIGEQVEVHSEFGNADSGTIHRSFYSDKYKEPSTANENTMIIEFKDGAHFTYDTQAGLLSLKATKEVKIIAPAIGLICDSFHCTGDADIDGALNVDEDLHVGGGIEDGRGDLSNFTTTDGADRA